MRVPEWYIVLTWLAPPDMADGFTSTPVALNIEGMSVPLVPSDTTPYNQYLSGKAVTLLSFECSN